MFHDGFLNFLMIVIMFIFGYGIYKIYFKTVVLFEYEKGIVYKNGEHIKTLGPGKHKIIGKNKTFKKMDIRRRVLNVKPQELPSSDGIGVKVSMVVKYQINDPVMALHNTQSYEDELYSSIQIALRGVISTTEIDNILTERSLFGEKLTAQIAEEVSQFGIKLISADIKDIVIPGDFKKMFAQSVKARKEANAALERARGETAAMRSLANAAKMAESNPNLLYLRIIQMLGESEGNTVSLNLERADKAPIESKG